MIADNAVVSTQRKGAYDPATKQTPGYSAYLSNVSCYITDPSRALRPEGFAVEYDLVLTCEALIDIRDDDYVTGWNPLGLTTTPTYIVKHVNYSYAGLGAHRTCFLSAYRGSA